MIHDILSENVRKEIDSIRSKFPHDKNKSSIIESLPVSYTHLTLPTKRIV